MWWRARLQAAAGKTPEAFRAGDDVRVWFRLRELGKERVAHFEGVVIRVRGAAGGRTFTVRRLTHGVGVERVFPMDAPVIDRIEVLRRGKTRRSRLYFLRRVVKSTRLASAEGPGAPRSDGSQGPGAAPAGESAGTGAGPDDAVAAGERAETPGPAA